MVVLIVNKKNQFCVVEFYGPGYLIKNKHCCHARFKDSFSED
jgi:hypothetical protein